MEEEKMNILVIGNGFDLEHGLPTQYKDFLDFMDIFRKLLRFRQEYVSNGVFNKDKIKKELEHEVNEKVLGFLEQYFLIDSDKFNSWKNKDNTNILAKCIGEERQRENFWLRYFRKNSNYIDKLWVDFENEISKVIQTIEYARRGYKFYQKESRLRGQSVIVYFEETDERKNELMTKISQYSGINLTTWYMLNDDLLEKLIDILKEDLNEITQCLEIYLCDYVGKIEIRTRSRYIKSLHYDCVLSFNYTDTFKKLYKLKDINKIQIPEPYCYVHGKADIEKHITNNNNGIVLGIDEYLDDNEKNKNLDFIYFKKFYQRIYNTTDVNYKQWINQMNKYDDVIGNVSYVSNNIDIFGHSLDVSDRQILRQLILESGKKKGDGAYENNTKITIYHKGDKAKSEQIKNLVRIIGEDKLMEMTTNGNIIFIPQDK